MFLFGQNCDKRSETKFLMIGWANGVQMGLNFTRGLKRAGRLILTILVLFSNFEGNFEANWAIHFKVYHLPWNCMFELYKCCAADLKVFDWFGEIWSESCDSLQNAPLDLKYIFELWGSLQDFGKGFGEIGLRWLCHVWVILKQINQFTSTC